jgi:Bifunctional DNA primase/polymerase, N-terminal
MKPPAADAVTAALSIGLPVFPCRISKDPACPHGFRDAVVEPDAIRQLWDRHPGPLVGVPSGPASGLDALDIDPRHRGDEWLAQNGHRLPVTRTHRTRSGGWHLLFACQSGLRNSTSKIAPEVDVRADGGYVVWWPALGSPVTAENTLALWPQWLLDKLLPQPSHPSTERLPRIRAESRYIAAAIAGGVAVVRRAAVGTRNQTLNREAFALARFVTGGAVTARCLAVELARAAAMAGLREREIVSTLASAFRTRGLQ